MTGRTARSVVLTCLAVVGLTVGGCSSAGGASSSAPSTAPSSAAVTPAIPPRTIDTPEAAMAAIVAAHPEFADIRPHDPDAIGQSRWWAARPASGVGAFVVQVSIGWGDCPAGCIDSHTWTFAVSPDGEVRLVSETGAPVPPEELRPGGDIDRTAVGVTGHVTAGPVCPIVQNPPDPACAPRPVAGATIRVSDASGTEVATAKTDDQGGYVVALPPGDYLVSADPVEGLLGSPEPIPASVAAGALVTVDLGYDTGIR